MISPKLKIFFFLSSRHLSDDNHKHHVLGAADLSKGTLFKQLHCIKGVNFNMGINLTGSQAVLTYNCFFSDSFPTGLMTHVKILSTDDIYCNSLITVSS